MSFTESAVDELIIETGSYNYQSTIPKSCVHRAAIGEVFLTDIRKINDNKYITAGYLPKSHIYFNDLNSNVTGKKVYDAILLLEICRQSSIYVTHNFFDVPYSAKFVFDDADFTLLESEIEYKESCSNVIIEVNVIERKHRKMTLTGLIFQMDIYVDGNLCARKEMNISWMEVLKWNRLRSNRPQECYNTMIHQRASALSVGRQLPLNVVISNIQLNKDTGTTTLVIDQNHPSIFDHPLDHVPGMLLIEAFRQTAIVTMQHYFDTLNDHLVISRYRINFQRFCEFNLPVYCHIDVGNILNTKNEEHIIIPMIISQGDNVISQAELTVTNKK
jgi:hypothetical protein